MTRTQPDDELVFLPLGGSNEIGMNFNLYGFGPPHARKWIVVDLGVTFGDQTTPGVEIILPDPTFIEEHADDILGIVLTHAHEDHIGAVAWLWPRLKAPLYATPFTAFLLREKLREKGLLDEVADHRGAAGRHDQARARSRSTLITLTHSIPEPNGLAIRTPLGTILHTGDWKIDPDPLTRRRHRRGRHPPAGRRGRAGHGLRLHQRLRRRRGGLGGRWCARPLNKLIGELKGKVAVACFASNVARMDTVIRAAEANGRRVCLVGRSMHPHGGGGHARWACWRASSRSSPTPRPSYFPADKVLYLCTGSQGEAARGAVAHRRRHPPAREPGAGRRLHLLLAGHPGQRDPDPQPAEQARRPRRAPLHRARPSGHPRLRPPVPRRAEADVPVGAARRSPCPTHGERRHLLEHAAFARDLQVPQSVAPRNGDMVRLAPGRAEIIDEVPAGRLYVDAGVVTPENGDALRERRHAAFNGMLTVSIALDREGASSPGRRCAPSACRATTTIRWRTL